MPAVNRSLILAVIVIGALIVAIFAAHARDSGQWTPRTTKGELHGKNTDH
jgi:hypothetical protein